MAVRNVSEGHVMLVTVCGYEQNPSRVVGEVVDTRFWVVHTRMDRRSSANLNRHPQNCVWQTDIRLKSNESFINTARLQKNNTSS